VAKAPKKEKRRPTDDRGKPAMKRLDSSIGLIAAAELFMERGYDSVTMEEIAERAGCGRRTLFNQHHSKNGMLVGIVRLFHERLSEYVVSFTAVADGASAVPSCKHVGAGLLGGIAVHRPPGLRDKASLTQAFWNCCLRNRCADVVRVALGAMDLPWIREPTSPTRARLELTAAAYLSTTADAAGAAHALVETLRLRIETPVQPRGLVGRRPTT
jgi:AcrR family transcriptional regulator